MRLRSERHTKRVPLSAGAGAKGRVRRIIEGVTKEFPAASIELNYRTPLELLVATILSAQCTDKQVNKITPALFRRYEQPCDYAQADRAELESMIRSAGFFKVKAKSIIECGRILEEEFEGKVPNTLEALTSLPGIGRKTANVILGTCFGVPAIVVDTHVKRVAQRLQLTSSSDPAVIERDFQRILPKSLWSNGTHRLLLHGRHVCLAKRPRCEQCAIYRDCSWEGKRPR